MYVEWMDSVKYKTYFRQTLPFEHEFSIYLRTCRLGKKSWLEKSDIERSFFTRIQFQSMSKSIKKQNMGVFFVAMDTLQPNIFQNGLFCTVYIPVILKVQVIIEIFSSSLGQIFVLKY